MKRSYIVDLAYKIIRPDRLNPAADSNNQELFCKCGARFRYKGTVKKEIIIFNGPITPEKNSLESLQCPSCREVYKFDNQAHLLEPDLGQIVEVSYSRKNYKNSQEEEVISLIRERKYALYNRETNSLKEISVFDQLSFNENSRQTTLFINNSIFPDENYSEIQSEPTSSNDKKLKENNYFEKNLSLTIAAGNLTKISQFFGYIHDIDYINLEVAFSYLQDISKYVADFDEMQQLSFVSSIWNSYKIYSEKSFINGKEQEFKYRLIDDEFSFSNEKEKEEFQAGIYLQSLSSIAYVFFAVTSYSNLTTLFLTKGYVFFDEFISGKPCPYTNVLKHHNATFPNRIIEVAMNYNQAGELITHTKKGSDTSTPKKVVTENSDSEILKVSNIINNSIKYVKDIETIKVFYEKMYVTKAELEILLNKYDDSKVMPVFGFLGESSYKEQLTFKHIEHIIRYQLYKDYTTDFLNSYLDTIRTISQIIASQDKVKAYLNSRTGTISEMEKVALDGYLAVKSNLIFESKNSRALKRLHDNLSVLYSTFQDATKVQRYADAVQQHLHMDRLINYVKLEVIPSAVELQREHQVMHHCINTYLDRIGKGEYLAVRVRDIISNHQATLGLIINNKSIKFDQLKSFWNSRATGLMIDSVREFCKVHKIEGGNESPRDLSPDPSSVRLTEDCLDVKHTMMIRSLLKEELDKKPKNVTELTEEEITEIITQYKKANKLDLNN